MKKVELYAFVGLIGSVLIYLIFLLWAFLPDTVLESLGITFYPEKHWALAFPSFLVVTFCMIYIYYPALNMHSTKPFSSLYSIQDEQSKSILDTVPISEDGLPAAYDIPVDVVNNILYHPGVAKKVSTDLVDDAFRNLRIRKNYSSEN